ncbi:ATP-binding protein [Paramaledivibacter caminithermalis]|uniref:histidine kinase n=1 Tax=Paramaledivibacter caminithermalis (strain DSM 15212 / CIP 107654 / DViRD3) TaxID=1121301 RepID=A0A1M6NBW2_PARC5|nr:ATP-binding protein [Paramaledivibacter caminithermalis]SHJ93218.1 PAS/PAC sensor signal transduction histidine kinase [Paramaledivibacter caminithermalis DSM 15212]
MFKSIRWKFITVYFALVFIAMAIIGVFIIQSFQAHHLNVVRNRLNYMADSILSNIEKIPPDSSLKEEKEALQSIVERWSKGSFEELFVIDGYLDIIATDNPSFEGINAVSELDEDLIVEVLSGKKASSEKDDISQEKKTKNIVFPIKREGSTEIEGVLYLRSDLKDIYDSLDKSKKIMTQAVILALGITIILGYLIAKSITEPINDVTEKASLMAKGDFNQRVEVKSDDEIGKLAEMFNFLTDKLEITLGEISSEKSKMETILNYMADGLIAVYKNGRIIHANPKAMEMLGLSKETILQKKYDKLFEGLNDKLTLKYIMENNETLIGSETIIIDESIYTVDYAPFKDENNHIGGLVLVLKDVTKQQKLEKMRREFVANVSHELKTPLTSIKSYTETLLDGMLDDRTISEQFLKVVNSEADRMTRLVRDLLQLSNFDNNKTKFNIVNNDLVQLINQTVIKLGITAKNKNQRLEFVTDCEELITCFDFDRIEQVLLNIVSNAIKYTEDNGKISIYLEKKDYEALITVKDTGIGIPKEDLPRIFERFYRVDKARSRELGGTGLGLSIAKEIIEAHNGSIEINSEFNKGTEVKIRIPLQKSLCNTILNTV